MTSAGIVLTLVACGQGTDNGGSSAPEAPVSPAQSEGEVTGGGAEPSTSSAGTGVTETTSPFGRRDAPSGSVSAFLDFTTGGGEICNDIDEEVRPAIELVVFPAPVLVCAYDFNPDEAIDVTVGGPGGWVWQARGVADASGWAQWRLDDLPLHMAGVYVLEATQGHLQAESIADVAFDNIVAAVRPESIAIGETGRLIVGGGPALRDVRAYMYHADPERQGYAFAADLGAIKLDANGEGAITLMPRPGDTTGEYMITVPWPPGTNDQDGPKFSVPREDANPVDYILDGITRDHKECKEREVDLPANAIAAVECKVDSDLVDSVGFYLFGNEADMLDAYFERLASNGVAPDSGECEAGRPGERAWGNSENDRVGCFVNEQGFANLRWTVADGPLYIGVLGHGGDISALMDWSSDSPVGTGLWRPPE